MRYLLQILSINTFPIIIMVMNISRLHKPIVVSLSRMSFWKYFLSLAAIGFVCSSEIGPRLSNVEDFAQRYEVVGDGDKAKIRLYYESRCQGCIMFYTTALNGTVAKLASYLDLKTYPYGNAERKEVDGKTEITCQHGAEECYGNKLHACAIDVINNTTRSVFYNACLMSCWWGGPCSTDRDAINCGDLMGIDGKSIIECAKGEKGEQLLEYYGELTEKEVPDRLGAPWILLNGKYYDGTIEDFTKAVCDALAHPPPQCQ